MPPAWVIVACFVAAVAPLVLWLIVHHPDERHYTDAAIGMLRTGDYITPKTPAGADRFNKPILTYWAVAASYHLLGVTPFASRLPFLLTGCGIVYMTYLLGRLLGPGESAGRWAALIAAGNLQVIMSATRSIPDALLCLFTLISVYGLAAIVLFNRRTWLNYSAAYIGLGLAIASKGIPAAIVAAGVFAFAVWHLRDWRSMLRLVHWPTMLLGAIIGGGWFAAVYGIHGPTAMSNFANDQVAARYQLEPLKIVLRSLLFFGWCVAALLPWLLPMTGDAIRRRAWPWRQDNHALAVTQLVVCCTVVLGAATSLCDFVCARYVLPIVPLLAAWAGMLLARAEAAVVERWLRMILYVATTVVIVAGAALTVVNVQLGFTQHAIIILGVFGLTAAWLIGREVWPREATRVWSLGVLKLVAIPLALLGLIHILLPDDSEIIAQQVLARRDVADRSLLVVGKPSMASQIRVQSHGRAMFDQIEYLDGTLHPEHDVVLVTNPATLDQVDLAEYAITSYPVGIGDVSERGVLKALLAGTLKSYLDGHRKQVTLGVRKTRTAAAGGQASQR
ncbi:MAG: phospholipid carrier-dependent glycosyltransferase [Planctomycetales bacterium]|nr:phospholipid carrier-dependent glycosyltransferase [Planctomycetales bacterium]